MQQPRINYITNLDINNFSGGWSGMNRHVFLELSKAFDVRLVEKINPQVSFADKVISKALRVAGLRGRFNAFSKKRLNRIKQQVEASADKSAHLNFFHGSTPWVEVNQSIPYAAYLDCCFATYISVYHNQNEFNRSHLRWLFSKETSFLQKATCVFFSSNWALQEAKQAYDLNGNNFFVAGLGGAFENSDANTAKPYFLFVALDFFGKGGDKVVEAFTAIHKEFPEFSLKIVGAPPPQPYSSSPNVEYEGMFNKSNAKELAGLKKLFAGSYCFVFPTSKDMTPLVLVEALSLGCPVIATRKFGIPEIVKDNETGLLIDCSDACVNELTQAMRKMILNKDMRRTISHNANIFATEFFTWERTGNVISEKLYEHFPGWKR